LAQRLRRERTAVAAAMKMLRAYDWSKYLN
jgi:hypothetical protein